MSGCIKNDIPYPRIQQDILTLEAEGQIANASINTKDLTATIYLGEDVDITRVRFNEYTYTDGAESSENLLEGTYDLTQPISVSLTLYQTYQWIIQAEQVIERYFDVEGQIGATVIDVPGRRIVVTVPQTADLSALRLNSCKLGSANHTSLSPELKAGDLIDLTKPLVVNVTSFGRTEEWTVYARVTQSIVTTTSVDAWVMVIWAYGEGPADAHNTFEYRRADETEWHIVPDAQVTHQGGAFACKIPHLQPLTKYVVRAVTDQEKGNQVEVTTESTIDLIDGSFDQWWLKDNKIWCPWDENGTQFWDTGNTGAATLGNSNVEPSDFTPSGTGMSAKLATKFVGIGVIGKLAAGSIFTGKFEKVDGTNGILSFGRPWLARPTRLRGYYNYTTSAINYTNTELKALQGRPDTCAIYIALTDWVEPYQIRTNPNNRQLFDKNSPAVIAYAEINRGTSTDGWQEFDIPLVYRSTSRLPKYILVVAAASKYGDYFTGGTGTVLYVDQFSLEYDY